MTGDKVFILSFTLVLVNFTLASSQMLETKKPIKKIKEQKVEKIEDKVNDLSEKLKLTEEQKIKVREILTKAKEETVKILDEAGTKITKIDSDIDSAIEELLTQEQKLKFKGVTKAEYETDKWLKIYK
jgi:F0F1-type ATP synthase membrane subunit b/b'